MAKQTNGQTGQGAGKSNLKLTDTGVEMREETALVVSEAPDEKGPGETPDVDVTETEKPLLGAGDGPVDAAELENTARRGRFRRVALAAGVVAGLLALVGSAGYFWLGGSRQDAAHEAKPIQNAGNGAPDSSTRVLTAEEITRELQKYAPRGTTNPVVNAVNANDPTLPGQSPITDRLPNQDFSATVTPAEPQSGAAASGGTSVASSGGAALTSAGSTVVGSVAPATSTTSPTATPAEYSTAHSFRAQPIVARPAQITPTPAAALTPNPTPALSPAPESIPATPQQSAPLPPVGTLLPVRTVATLYTVRSTSYVRLQLTRDVAGPDWSLRRGTEFYGLLNGAEPTTGRAFITLLGYINPGTQLWQEFTGQLLGADGTEGLPGRTHRLNAGWRNAFKKAGALALDTATTIASGIGRRGVIITDGGAGRVLDPLTNEAQGRANGRNGDSFIEIPAATSGYILVTPGNSGQPAVGSGQP